MLTRSGFNLAILLPDKDTKILHPGSDLHTFRRDRRSLFALFRLVQAFLVVRRDFCPDLYFFNSTFSLLPLLVLRLVRDRTPTIYCAHCWAISNYRENSLKGRIVMAVEGRLAGLADLVVNVSNGDARLAKRWSYGSRHVVIENAVPDRAEPCVEAPFHRGSQEEVHLLFVGRFDRQKGLDILLPAFERARVQSPNLRLHLVGDVVREGAIPALPEGVVHHGWCVGSEIDAYYAAADVLVVPSRWEGLPLIVPEALRNGTPVLVADSSDMPSLVAPGVTGGVFALNETALSACLASLDRAALQAMRLAARESYDRRFAMDRFIAEMSFQINSLLGRSAQI